METVEQLKRRVTELRQDKNFTNERINLLIDAAWQLLFADIPFAIDLNEQALKLATSNDYLRGRARALRNLAWCQLRDDQYQKAEQSYEDSRQTFLRLQDDAGLASVLNGLGATKLQLGNYESALDAHSAALHLREKLNDSAGVASTFINFGNINWRLGDYAQSLEYYYRALQTAIDCGAFVHQAHAYSNLANVLWRVGEAAEAIRCSEQALILFRQHDQPGQGFAVGNLAAAQHSRGEYKEALDNYRIAFETAQLVGNATIQVATKIGTGNIYCEVNDAEQAFEPLCEAVQLAQSVGSRFYESQALLWLGKAHEQTGDARNSVELLERSLEISQQLNIKEVSYKAHLALAEAYEAQRKASAALFHYKAFHQLWNEVAGGASVRQIQAFLVGKRVSANLQDKLRGFQPPPLKAEALLPARKLREVIEFIAAHPEENVAVSELARMAALSQRQFQRSFKRVVGTTPHQFILEQRLKRAGKLLQSTNLPLVEIALQCGFSSQSHLTLHFRQATGKTPHQWRRSK